VSNATPAEQGYTNGQSTGEEPFALAGPRPDLTGRPPGGGRFAVPAYQTFQATYRAGGQRTWRTLYWDEARAHGGLANSLAMRNDPVVWAALRERQLPTSLLDYAVEARDEEDQEEQALAEEIGQAIEGWEDFQAARLWLLEDMYYGKSAIDMAWGWCPYQLRKGKRRPVVREWKPVLGDKLILNWDGSWSVMVNMSQYEGDTQMTDGYGPAHRLTEIERESFCISVHEPEDPDYQMAEQGGRFGGVGLRSRLWHLWWIKTNLYAIGIDFLQMAGAGIIVYWYELGNDESLQEVKRAAENQVGSNVLLMPRHANPNFRAPDITRFEPGVGGQQLLQSLIGGYLDSIIRRTILLQSTASEVGDLQLGGAAADVLESSGGRVIKYDAIRNQACINRDIVQPMARAINPRVQPPRFRYTIEKPDAGAMMQFAQGLYEMGYGIEGDSLARVGGISPPRPGKTILSKNVPMQPQAVTGLPSGTPVATPAGPVPTDQGQNGQVQQPQDGQPAADQPVTAVAPIQQGVAAPAAQG
jgi:hypothetical protein